MANWCTRILVVLLLSFSSMCRGREANFPWDGNKLLISKSWGFPLELRCEEIESQHIKVSGITIARKGKTVTAENEYPGIQVKAQKACYRTFRMPTGSRPGGCTIDLPELGVRSNVMVITVFWCYSRTASSMAAAKNRIASSKSGDVTLKCFSKDIIHVHEIQLDNEPMTDFKLQAKICLNEMMRRKVPQNRKRAKPAWALCSIKRKGRKGDLKVKYSCDSPPKHAHQVSEPQRYMYPMIPS